MFYSKKFLKYKNIEHCFFNRKGGYSKGIYKSLNCGRGSKDNKNNIYKNLNYVCKKISPYYKDIILLNQIHSNKFYLINNQRKIKNLKGDALITNQKKIILGILTADRVPVLIYDKKLKMISAIHAGWRGAYKGIIQKVVNFMKKNGSESKNLVAAIGPCISQENYEIQNKFKNKFLKQDKRNHIFFKKNKNKTYFSLNKYVYYQLKTLKIKEIDNINKDTYNPKNNFFSARRSIHNKENDYGRNISLIMIN